jgi:hypothetical protein
VADRFVGRGQIHHCQFGGEETSAHERGHEPRSRALYDCGYPKFHGTHAFSGSGQLWAEPCAFAQTSRSATPVVAGAVIAHEVNAWIVSGDSENSSYAVWRR